MYESGEDYLEAILVLQEANGYVRSVDIARHLNVSKPSVSRAMSILGESGHIVFDDANMIKLTEIGLAKARDVYGRHQLLTKFFEKITGLPTDQCEENACRVEHDIDADVVKGIENWMKKQGV